MAIKQLLELIGDDIVISKLSAVQKKGEETLAAFNKPLPELKFTPPDSKPIEDLTSHTVKLKDALHVLAPILRAGGAQLGEFGAFARLASGNIVAFAAALAGAVAVGLARLEENAARTRGQLDDLFGGSFKGDQAFKALNSSAKQFGTSVADLVPGIESLKRALDAVSNTKGFVALRVEDLPSVAGSLAKITASYENFLKILRAGRLTETEAEKAAKAFFDTFKEGGPLTVASLQALPVGSLKLLQEALGRGGQTAKDFFGEVKDGKITIDEINKALAVFGPQAQKAFDTKAIHTIADEFNKLLKTLSGTPGTIFSTTIITGLSLVDTALKNTIKIGENFVTVFSNLAAPIQDAFNRAFRPDLKGAFGGTAEEINKIWEGVGSTAAKSFGKGFINNPFFETGAGAVGANLAKNFMDNPFFKEPIKIPVVPEVKTVPTEDQAALVEQFRQSGIQGAATFDEGFQQGIDLSPVFSKFQSLYEQVKQLFAQPIPVVFRSEGGFGNQAEGAPFAGGGIVRGPGSTTSDSILAFLSNKEFVVNAKAVSHYGSELFAALNAMRLPRDFMGFNMGGLAQTLSNKFATGGLVSTGSGNNRSLTLVLDQKQFGLTGSKRTIDDLEREASLRGLAMIGKAPSWIR